MKRFSTTLEFINNHVQSGGFPAGEVIETHGYTTSGDRGLGKWAATGNTIAASQTVLDTNDIKISDASGNEFELIHSTIIDLNVLGGTTAPYVTIATNAGLVWVQSFTSIESNAVLSYATLDILKNSSLDVGDVGRAVKTEENTAGNGGGGEYSVVLTSAVTPNGYDIIQSVANPLISFKLRNSDSNESREFGATPSPADSTDEIKALFERTKDLGGGEAIINSGNNLVSAQILPDDEAFTEKLSFKGRHRTTSKITAAIGKDEQLFNVKEAFPIEMLWLESTTGGSGVAVGTSNTRQSAVNTLKNSTIKDFRFAVWNRASVYNSYSDLTLIDNTCGIRLSRHDYQTTNANPDAPANWNIFSPLGWYNNAISMKNVNARGGEVGIWATSMCTHFDTVVCEGQDTDGTTNDVLPLTQKGTGLYVDSGTSGTKSWSNVATCYYSEATEICAYIKDQEYFQFNGFFAQGGPNAGDRLQAALIADNSTVELTGFVGQQWFDNIIEAKNGAVVYLNSKGGPISGPLYSADPTSRVKMRGTVDKNKYEYFLDKPNGTPLLNFVIPETLPDHSVAKIYFDGLYAGATRVGGEHRIVQWNSAAAGAPLAEWVGTSPAPQIAVAVSAGGVITITLNDAFGSLGVYATLEIIGGHDVSGNALAITGTP